MLYSVKYNDIMTEKFGLEINRYFFVERAVILPGSGEIKKIPLTPSERSRGKYAGQFYLI